MQRYIAYRVQRMTDTSRGTRPFLPGDETDLASSPSWKLFGHTSPTKSDHIGNFATQNDAFAVLNKIAGIQGVEGRMYYLVEPSVREVSARIGFEGIRDAALPKVTRISANILSDAGTGEELLFLVGAAQTFFWNAVRNLEIHLGIEIDSAQDFQDADLHDLKASPGTPV